MERQYTRRIPPFGLRLQPFLKKMVEEAAKQNCRSQNMEIHARLERSFREEAQQNADA